MEKINVKVLTSNKDEKFEVKINNYLEELYANKKEVVDIKYQMIGSSMFQYYHSAIIMYK